MRNRKLFNYLCVIIYKNVFSLPTKRKCGFSSFDLKMSQKLSNGNCAVSNKCCGKVDKTSLVVVVQRKNKIKHATDLYSSKDRKRAHESSADVLPPRNSPTDDSTYLQSSYTVDFNKKEGKPACMRPCSVTRRNRPHPLMVCKVDNFFYIKPVLMAFAFQRFNNKDCMFEQRHIVWTIFSTFS